MRVFGKEYVPVLIKKVNNITVKQIGEDNVVLWMVESGVYLENTGREINILGRIKCFCVISFFTWKRQMTKFREGSCAEF